MSMRTSAKLRVISGMAVILSACSGTDDTAPVDMSTSGGYGAETGGTTGGGATQPSSGGATQPSSGGATSAGGMDPGAGGQSSLPPPTGGAASTGGTKNATGGSNSGGSSVATGGRAPTGGRVAFGGFGFFGGKASTGGVTGTQLTTGGQAPVGGSLSSGGMPTTGGAMATGGAAEAGGALPTGGMSATGGAATSTSATGGTPATGGTSGTPTSVTVNCGGTAGSAACPEGDDAMCGMLDEHNKVRAAAPGADPAIPPLVWDCSLAATAQAWADTCPSGHSGTSGMGENIYWSGSTRLSTPAQVVGAWASELSAYEYSINYCDGAPYTVDNFAGCGHYTQIVWRTTTRVGCGYANNCSSGRTQPWVCNYAPAGNIYNSRTGALNLPY